ncbi:hypothetical protein QBC39DRAFT_169416 [Podospora conica]|nr:hypothetical protein QBC39DRAFT_169416 [Schizothecium conicum]
MSRNVRKKHSQTPVKAAKPVKRRGSDTTTSSIYLSSDDDSGYSGVEDVSESDEADPAHVNAAEDRFIRLDASRKRSPPRPHVPEEDDDADEEAEADEDAAEESDGDDEDDVAAQDEGEYDNWEGFPSEMDSTTTEQVNNYLIEEDLVLERRVRFTGVPDSDSDSTASDTSENHSDFFPDIFVDQNSLDPGFKRQLEVEDDDSSTSGSYWDLTPGGDLFSDDTWRGNAHNMQDLAAQDLDDTPTATPMASRMVSAVSSPTPTIEDEELDGYESDGETTEEDEPQPLPRQKQMQRFSHIEPSPDSDMEKATPVRRGRPRVGRFNLDASEKPIAVLNPTTRKMMIFTPNRRSQLDEALEVNNPLQSMEYFPLIADPGAMMMAAMSSVDPFGPFLTQQPMGPMEAFYQYYSGPATDEDSDHSGPEQEDEGEAQLRMEDFLTFHPDSSSDEEEDAEPTWGGDATSSPSRPQTAASGMSAATDGSVDEASRLFDRFDKNADLVGAFRRNQHNQKLLSGGKVTQESLAFSNPLNLGTLRTCIKNGSMGAVATSITPQRRHKKSLTMGAPILKPELPVPQTSPSQKRKAPERHSDESSHKKQCSISEIGSIQL